MPGGWFTSRFAAGGILTFTLDVVPLSAEATGPWPQVAVGPMQTIEFVGELGAFAVGYAPPDPDPNSCCGGGYTRIPITRWTMSREDADLLGLRRRRGTGDLTFDMDYNNRNDPPDYHELRTYDTVDLAAVPEPALVGLVLLGVGASMRRWQRGRRASGRISTTSVPPGEGPLNTAR